MEVEPLKPMSKGHIDGVLTDILNIDRVLEHKALNHFTFQRFWNGELPLDYLTQTSIYTEAIQRKLNPDLKEALLLIKNKNTSQYMEFLCSYEWDCLKILERTHSNGDYEKMDVELNGIVQAAIDKFNLAQDYIDRHTLPKRQYDIDHWRCEYCPWGRVCWGEYHKEFKELKTDAILPNEFADMVRYQKEL
jgi:hypothetical protein